MKRQRSGSRTVLGTILLLLLVACYDRTPTISTVPFPTAVASTVTGGPTSPTATPIAQATASEMGAEYVYVTNAGSASVSVIDGLRREVVATISGQGLHSPTGIALGPDGRIYVANFFSPTLAVIDPKMNMITTTIALDWDELVDVAASSG